MTHRQGFWFNVFSLVTLILATLATLNAAGCMGGK
jgi:hypothetical protein